MIAGLYVVHRAFPALPFHVYVDDMFIAAEVTRQSVLYVVPFLSPRACWAVSLLA